MHGVLTRKPCLCVCCLQGGQGHPSTCCQQQQRPAPAPHRRPQPGPSQGQGQGSTHPAGQQRRLCQHAGPRAEDCGAAAVILVQGLCRVGLARLHRQHRPACGKPVDRSNPPLRVELLTVLHCICVGCCMQRAVLGCCWCCWCCQASLWQQWWGLCAAAVVVEWQAVR